jgi:carboxyl-terminal processing protease
MKKPIFNTPSKKFIAGIFVGIFIVALVIPIVIVCSDNIYNQIKKYEGILSMAVKDYFEDVDIVKLNEGAIRGMLQELDPHSSYISAKDMKSVEEDMSGSFEGVGIQFDMAADTLIVEGVIPDGPCEKIGVQMRDRIVKVDGKDIVGVSRDSVPKLLKGPKGTIVNLSIFRPGNKGLMEFTVVRDKIPIHAVHSHFMIQGTDIGYIRLADYNKPTTHREVVDAAKQLRTQGMKRLVLDLR